MRCSAYLLRASIERRSEGRAPSQLSSEPISEIQARLERTSQKPPLRTTSAILGISASYQRSHQHCLQRSLHAQIRYVSATIAFRCMVASGTAEQFHYAWYIRPRPLPNSRYLSRPTLSITLQSRLCKQPSSRYARQHSAHCHHHHRRRLLLFPAGPQSSSILQHQAS